MRKTKEQIINLLNEHFEQLSCPVKFRNTIGSNYSIEIFTAETKWLEENQLPRPTETFYEQLEVFFYGLGIATPVSWNNTGNIFYNFIDSKTSAWDK